MWLPSLKTLALTASLATVGIGIVFAAAAAASGRPEAEDMPAPAPAPSPTPDPRPAAGPASPLPQDSGERPQRASRKSQKAGSSPAIAPDLARRAPGPIIRAVPVSKDLMILSYIPDWNFGHVDNIGIGNPDGGNRTLIDWPEIPAEEANDSGRRFVLAIYARKTVASPHPGPLVACEVLEKWTEETSWNTRPQYDPEPIGTYKFEPGEGWKLFDVTPAVRARAKAGRQGHGILLRFLSEEASGSRGTLANYFLVSREGAGEWAGRRPVLLVVTDAKPGKATK